MRIAQIMLGKGFGGAERSFVDLSRALAARGHALLAIGERRGVALAHLQGGSTIEVERVRCLGAWDPFCRRAIARILTRFAPDLVQTHLARAATIAGPPARALGIPTIAKTHNLVKLDYYRAIDLLIPTTREQENYLLAHGVSPAGIVRIPNFRAIATAEPGERPASAQPVVKAIGRLVHKKGFDVLLHAAARLPADANWRLEIAGDGPERAALHALAADLGLGGRVVFRGWVEDVAAYLADATLFVLPSRIEPFGIALLEAMALGIPIVTTQASGPLEILDETSAWFVPADDADALAAAIAGASAQPAASFARARAALDRFRRYYSEDVVVQRYLDVYAELTQR